MKRLFLLTALFLLAAFSTLAQVPVALLPPSHQQFFLPNGAPNAGGCLFFFNSGTSTPAPTYTDVTGTILNANPVTLDASGSATIYLQNQEYRVQYTNPPSTGFTCATGAGAQIFSQDGVSAFQVTSTTPSVMFAGVTADPSGTAGEMVYRSDIPCFRVFTSFWDCLVQTTLTQTISNKTINTSTLNSPTIVTPTIGGTINQNGPATYATLPNFNIGGTVLNNLVVFNGTTGQVFQSSTSSGQGGANPALIGICVTGCGTANNATVQQSGVASCVFDGATTAGDYVQQSSTNAGQCHDAGATYPTANQILGRVLSTNGASGTFQVDLFGSENRSTTSSAIAGCTNFTPVTVTNNNAQQNLLSCTIAPNALTQGSLLSVDLTGIQSTASSQTITLSASIGGGTVCSTLFSAGVANNQPYNFIGKFAVLTSGAGGTANWSCEFFGSGAVTTAIGPNGVVGMPTISVNTTISNTLLITETMSVANAGNSVTGQLLKAVIF